MEEQFQSNLDSQLALPIQARLLIDRLKMNSNLLKKLSLCGIATQLGTGIALAQPTPSLIGTWTGESHSISVDGSTTNPTSSWEKPALGARKITLEVTQQKDRRFWGKVYANGQLQGPFIGVLGVDTKTVSLIGPNAKAIGTLLGNNEIEYCYLDANIASGNSLYAASCSELFRK
jgi:hypothetical protein